MMKKFWILLSIYSLLPLCLPELKPPEEYLALNYLSQILSKRQDTPVPYIRISLILEGREYFPGETIDLGMGDPFKLITRNIILKNSGKFAISLDSNGPPSITSNSLGSLSLKSDSSIPENWPPGDEFRITLNAFPGSDSENTWNVRLSIVSPEEIFQEFSFRILSTPIKTGRLFYSILNPPADRGIVSRTFDSETETWGAEFIHINNPSSYVFAPTEYGRFIYYNRATPAEVHGNYIDSDGILQSVPINTNVTLNASFTNGSFIPIRNRILTQGGSGNLITTTYNNTTGALDPPTGPFGTQCVSRFIRSTPNGDFVIQPHGNVIGFPGRFQIGKVETDGSLTNVYNSPIYYEDPDPSNRLSVWWKHFINDNIYFVSHTGTPGINKRFSESLELLIPCLGIFIFFHYLLSYIPYPLDSDIFFHSRIGDEYKKYGIIPFLDFTQDSITSIYFFDTSLLFHQILRFIPIQEWRILANPFLFSFTILLFIKLNEKNKPSLLHTISIKTGILVFFLLISYPFLGRFLFLKGLVIFLPILFSFVYFLEKKIPFLWEYFHS
ncbi:MAG: hypothetical protein JJT78_16960 [Leptospira sp.]|nr:hypothetical protein [Leptospira sp.]